MPNSSTSACLIHLQDCVTNLLDLPQIKNVSIVSFDLQKAFDTVPHQILIQKLSTFLPQSFLTTFESFLMNRHQQVKIKDTISHSIPITSGVPQGCILSPILFNVIINDLTFGNDSYTFKYADDTTVVIAHKDADVAERIGGIIDKMTIWCKTNRLVLNFSKTQIMTINPNSTLNLHPNNQSNIKLLGVVFNCRLKWDDHIDTIVKRASRKLYILYSLKNVVGKKELIILYKSLIESIINYCSCLFIYLPHHLERKLLKLYKRCHYVICHQTCENACIHPPSHIRTTSAIKFFIKSSQNEQHAINPIIPQRMPASKKICQPFSKTNRRKLAFIPTITEILNNL